MDSVAQKPKNYFKSTQFLSIKRVIIKKIISKKEFPKVLIISESPKGSKNGFGVTLDYFFGNWDKTRITNIYTDQAFQKEFKEKENYLLAHIPFHAGLKYALPFLFGIIPEWRNNFSKKWIKKNLKKIKPDLIYSFVYSSATLQFSTLVAKITKLPFIFHIADDITQEENGEIIIRKAIQFAKRQFVISENMKTEYQKIFIKDFDVFHFVSTNIVPSYRQLQNAEHKHQPKVIRFIGSYHKIQHEDAVADVIDVLKRINQPNVQYNLEFWGTETPTNALNKLTEDSIYKGMFHDCQKLQLIGESDLLIIPSTFDAKVHKYYKNSFPTKLTEFLLSGVPVLVYGPSDSSSSIFCKKHSVGIIINKKCKESLFQFLKDFTKNQNSFDIKARNDSIKLRKTMDEVRMQDKFQDLLQL